MEIHILFECKAQPEYTEPHYYAAADDAKEGSGVYDSYLKASDEKERHEALVSNISSDDVADSIYYEIETHTVE